MGCNLTVDKSFYELNLPLIVNGDNSFVVLSEEGERSGANVHVLASEGDRIIATPVEDSTHITAVINDITPGR